MKGICQKETSQLKGKMEEFEQSNKLVLDYNLEYKINIHESILMWIDNKKLNK